MLDLFRDAYYTLDLLVGFGTPLLFFLLYRVGRIDRFAWHCFWIGVAIGALWEIPIFVLSGESETLPIVQWIRPFPTHYLVFMVSHSLWDGLLFGIGMLLVHRLCAAPHFRRFRWSELGVLWLWGQASELLVELSSTFNDGWVFVEYWWNPTMFRINGHGIAVMMQAIWGVAPILFYLVLLRIRPRYD